MKIAYLMSQHPYPSCTFIRREIAAIEAAGIPVARFSIRLPDKDLADEADKQEPEKTRYILGVGAFGLLLGLLRVAFGRPLRWWKALQLTVKIGWGSDRGVLINLIYLLEACVLLQWLLDLGIEHVHAHFATNGTTVAMLCNLMGGPQYSFTVHGPHEFDKPEALALPEKIKRAAFVAAVCSYGKSQLFRWCDYKQWSKIHVIRCGVDKMFLSQPYVPLPNQPRFVCVGRLGEQKGHLILIEAVSQLAAEGFKFKVILVGDGPLRNEIETLISQMHLEDYIEITGWATNAQVQQQILAAQVMVLPSFAEGLPVVVMEALALSRPVIGTYIAGIPELVEPGKCGWLVPSGSASALAAAMRTVLQTPVEELAKMGTSGAESVALYHDAAQEASKLLNLFQTYLENG
ncbi:glycosyltransferase [Microseira wollei]|uniref:Glycosyl transferase, group 1 n=1 Tax=Microseira wollei NIES-4236 TaxID=2530354 RepID=A0AAV3X0R7_9CYAN|nr:glycosyltransferase [Microseira wollei]GET35753.1 glycosyl transferase, group 1 [Microseira wollei NIES-4236]